MLRKNRCELPLAAVLLFLWAKKTGRHNRLLWRPDAVQIVILGHLSCEVHAAITLHTPQPGSHGHKQVPRMQPLVP